MHKKVMHYRDEYNKALGRFYACKHLSRMNEVSVKVNTQQVIGMLWLVVVISNFVKLQKTLMLR